MAYDGKVLRQATLRFDEDKQRRQEQQRRRQQQVYQQCPELEGIQREIRGTMGEIDRLRSAAWHGSPARHPGDPG